MNNIEIISNASAVIKPSLWFTNGILGKSNLATKKELDELTELTLKTKELKEETYIIDREIAKILTNIDNRELIQIAEVIKTISSDDMCKCGHKRTYHTDRIGCYSGLQDSDNKCKCKKFKLDKNLDAFRGKTK